MLDARSRENSQPDQWLYKGFTGALVVSLELDWLFVFREPIVRALSHDYNSLPMTDADKTQRRLTNLSLIQKEKSFEVESGGGGKRVDALVKNQFGWFRRGVLKKMAEEGRLLRNGTPIPAGRRVRLGDVITIIYPEPWEDVSEMDRIKLDALYEDEHILVLNKAPHIVVHPAGAYRYTTLLNALHKKYLGDKSDLTEDDPIPRLVHRIDKETSGVLVVAFQREAHSVLGKLFEERSDDIEKEYLALVEGRVEWNEKEIEHPLGPSPDDKIRLRRAVREDGQHAHTSVSVVERFVNFTLVRCKLHTGRQHQIRVHLKAEGHPLVGDHLYGVRDELREADLTNPRDARFRNDNVYLDETVSNEEAAERIRDVDASKRREYWQIEAGEAIYREKFGRVLVTRCALHCARMAFPHPTSGELMSFQAPLNADMELALEYLRKNESASS